MFQFRVLQHILTTVLVVLEEIAVITETKKKN